MKLAIQNSVFYHIDFRFAHLTKMNLCLDELFLEKKRILFIILYQKIMIYQKKFIYQKIKLNHEVFSKLIFQPTNLASFLTTNSPSSLPNTQVPVNQHLTLSLPHKHQPIPKAHYFSENNTLQKISQTHPALFPKLFTLRHLIAVFKFVTFHHFIFPCTRKLLS